MEIQVYNSGVRKALYVQAMHSGMSRPGGFEGPNRYVVVLRAGADNDAEFPRILHPGAIALRGFRRRDFGSGYGAYRGERSQLGQALARARAYMTTDEEY